MPMLRAARFALLGWTLAGPAVAAQITFEQATRDLASTDAGARLLSVQMLKDAAYPEAALPLARLVTDPEDEIQLEAIAAEINIHLVEKIVSRKRIGLVIEKRNRIAAEQVFAAGPAALLVVAPRRTRGPAVDLRVQPGQVRERIDPHQAAPLGPANA